MVVSTHTQICQEHEGVQRRSVRTWRQHRESAPPSSAWWCCIQTWNVYQKDQQRTQRCIATELRICRILCRYPQQLNLGGPDEKHILRHSLSRGDDGIWKDVQRDFISNLLPDTGKHLKQWEHTDSPTSKCILISEIKLDQQTATPAPYPVTDLRFSLSCSRIGGSSSY